jgi:hypothetical protein
VLAYLIGPAEPTRPGLSRPPASRNAGPDLPVVAVCRHERARVLDHRGASPSAALCRPFASFLKLPSGERPVVRFPLGNRGQPVSKCHRPHGGSRQPGGHADAFRRGMNSWVTG